MNQKLQDEYAVLQRHKRRLRKNINNLFPILLSSWFKEEIKKRNKKSG